MIQESRRKIIKGLAVTLPATWVTPVVESIISPAHAGMSGIEPETSFDLASEFPSTATSTDGQSCAAPITYFSPLVITNNLGCTANLVAMTGIGADDLIEFNGSIWPNASCGSATTSISSGTVLVSNVAPGASVTIRVLDAVPVVCPNCTGASGTVEFVCT